jgi:hypothetical protein
MEPHRNAKLGPAGRYALVRAVEDGCSLKAASAAFNVSPATACRSNQSKQPPRNARGLSSSIRSRDIPTSPIARCSSAARAAIDSMACPRRIWPRPCCLIEEELVGPP